MEPPFLASPSWYNGQTLAERHRLSPPNGALDAGRGQRRWQRWQEQPQFIDGAILAARLAAVGLDEERLLTILSTLPAPLAGNQAEPPVWLAALAEAYSRPPVPIAVPEPGAEELGFLELVQPLVDMACDRLYAGLDQLVEASTDLPFDPETIEDILLMNLPGPLLMRLSRTLVLELNVARLQGELQGDTPQARFLSFVERLGQRPYATALLAEYPVLARQLLTCIEQWVEVSLEFLGRLCADWQLLREQFSPGIDAGPLVELRGGAGDTHRNGRSVMIAQFESGLQLVYKPKSMAVDLHFQELLSWLNARGCEPPLRTLAVVDRGEYGWVEHVAYADCDSSAAAERFYLRLGAYLGLLYAINASDFHLENLIAAGEHPMLIDLETLFNPEFERFDEDSADANGARAMLHSVLVVGMLPQRMWSDDEYGGIDISGLGGEAGQLTPDRLPRATAAGTDEMRYVRERLALPGEPNRPRLDGVETNALDYAEPLITGFRQMCRLLVDTSADLLAEDGPLAAFAGDEIRVLMRPTRTYDQLLFESFHPDTLRDSLDRELLFDRLWLVAASRPYMTAVIPAELNDLHRGDIPVFTTRPASLTLWSGSGSAIEGVLTETGLTLARRRVAELDEAELRRQEWFIRCTLATLAPVDGDLDRPDAPPYPLRTDGTELSRPRLLAAARAMADRLAETAILGSDDVAWIGLTPRAAQAWDISLLGMDLYNGLPGIGLFLAYAGAVTGEEIYEDLARRAARATLRYAEQFREELSEIGSYEGWGGILYFITHLGALWNDAELLAQAEALAVLIGERAPADETFTISGGAAGAILALLSLHRSRPAPATLAAAVACGDRLLAAATPSGWSVGGEQSPPLTGFAHGAAGIALALLELAAAARDERYRAAAQQALGYERSLYNPQVENWPDLRNSDASRLQYASAWCHGAPGIGLSRLHARRHLADPLLDEELAAALRTTRADGFGHGHCLCHGDLGNLELLLAAGQLLGDCDLQSEASRLAAMVLDSIERLGPLSGGPAAVEMPGLMLGLAGIGYQLLRLAAPERVPSVLVLAPPLAEPVATGPAASARS